MQNDCKLRELPALSAVYNRKEGEMDIHMHMHAPLLSSSDSLRPRGWQPPGLLCPWNFPDKNTGVGRCFLIQRMFLTQGWNPCLLNRHRFITEPPREPLHIHTYTCTRVCVCLVAQSCPTLCDLWTVAHQAPPSMEFSR